MANDLDTLGKRLESLHSGESTLQFAKRIGESDTTVGNYERNVRTPKADFLARLRERTGVDLNWLITGAELPSETREESTALTADEAVALIDRFDLRVSAGVGGHSEVAASTAPMPFGVDWLRRHRIKPGDVSVLEVSGDSQEPVLYSGDPILVNKRRSRPVSGKLYVVVRPDRVQVKFVMLLRGSITLASENPAYPPEQIDKRETPEPEFYRVRWYSHFLE
ncbi:MAG TPA: S24 family peptidase [Devosia sp.]|nr:S24 family peptidase [Devosia sp.]